MIDRSNVLEHFFWLSSRPFFIPKGAPTIYWIIQWRCYELLNSIGITLKRIREESAQVKECGLGNLKVPSPVQTLLLDEEVFYRIMCTLMENIAAFTPILVSEGGFPNEKATTPKKLIKVLREHSLESELCSYLERNLDWYHQIAKNIRNPMTHVGSMRFMDASENGKQAFGLVSILHYHRTNETDAHEVTASLGEAIGNIQDAIDKLFDFLVFYTNYCSERASIIFKTAVPDMISNGISAFHGCEELKTWANKPYDVL